jgi:hypothetical protein
MYSNCSRSTAGKATRGWDGKVAFASDREAIRQWLVRSLLKASGIWGSGLDTLLTALRDVIKANNQQPFPAGSLEREMEARGKSLTFAAAEIEDILSMTYGDKRLFALLSLIFPFVDLRNQFHIDHIFPISRFTARRLRKIGIPEDEIEKLGQLANELPNLQLLEGPANTEKQAAMPASWLHSRYSHESDRDHYRSIHLLGEIPHEIQGCKAFWEARRGRLRVNITSVLNHVAEAPLP